MRRRDFISLISGATSWPFVAHAQQLAMPTIGFIDARSPDVISDRLNAFRQGLKETGHVEGETVSIVYRFAENQLDRVPALAADLVRRQVAVIAAFGDDVVGAAKAATTTVPIVFTVAQDPVGIGLVASLARPGGNMTGINILAGEMAAKRLGLLREMVPGATRIAALVNPAKPVITEPTLRDLEVAALSMGLQILPVNVVSRQDIDAAFTAFAGMRPDAIFVGIDTTLTSRRVQVVNLTMRYGIPAIFAFREFTEIGGLMSYGANILDAFRQSGIYVGRILKGAKPADMPVVQSTKFEFVINAQSARTLGIEVPRALIVLADEVIE